MPTPANITPATQDKLGRIVIEFAIPGTVQAAPTAEQVAANCGPELVAVVSKIKSQTGNAAGSVSAHVESIPAVYVF